MSLAEFLLARIEEDEAVARATILQTYGQRGEWVTFDNKEHLSQTTVFAWQNGDKLGQVCDTEMSWIGRPARDHIARWDPARVLAECEAKRRIVESIDVLTSGEKSYTERLRHTTEEDARYVIARDILRLLALPYTDHPDYRQEWRP